MPDYTEHYSLKKPKKTENYDINDVTRDNADLIDKALCEKVDKLPNKGLSTNDFTDNYKIKLDGLKNYDDSEVRKTLNTQDTKLITLEQKKNMLASAQPHTTVKGETIHIEDSAEWDENKLEICGNLRQEKRSGKNSFNINDKKTVDEVYTVDDEGWITCEYDNSEGTDIKYLRYYTNNLKLKTNTQYAIFVEIKNASGTGRLSPISYYTDSQFVKTFDIYFSDLKPDDIYKFVVGTKDNFSQSLYGLRTLCIFQPGKSGSITFRISVLEDTSVTTDNFKYEKYGAMPSTKFPSMPVVCTGVQKIRQFGENWFNKNNISKTNAVVDISSIVANSSGKTFYIKIEPGTYTVSRKVIGARFVVGTTANIPKIGETIIDRIVNNSGSSITLTTSKNANYLVVYYLYNSSENEQEILDSIQIVRGSKAKKYKSYIEEINTLDLKNTELCAIKDTNGNVVAKDRAVYRNGKWQWKKKIKKFALKGTENFGKSSNTANISYYLNSTEINNIDINTIPNAQTNRDFVVEATCNYFRPVSLNTLFSNTEGFTIDIADAKRIELRLGFKLDTEITTVALLKELLAQKYAEGNPVTIYFILATPVYEDCTAEQSAILDKLYNNFTLQKGTNNIIVETDNGVGVNMQLDYMQDLQTKLNLLEAMCVSNASQEV